MEEGITIQSNRGGTIYKDKDGNEIAAPKDVEVKEEKEEVEKPKRKERVRD